jgi:hypothetical protein
LFATQLTVRGEEGRKLNRKTGSLHPGLGLARKSPSADQSRILSADLQVTKFFDPTFVLSL